MTRPALPRVLHVGKFYPPVGGGIERVVACACSATAGRLDNRVLAYNHRRGRAGELVDGVPVTRLDTVSVARSTPIAPGLIGELRDASDDLIVLHEPNPWALVACAIARPRQPLVIWYHSEVVRPRLQYALFYHPLVKTVYARAARIIVASPALAEHAAALRSYRSRLAVVPYGIDPEAWTAAPRDHDFSARVRARAAGRPIVLFTGRLVAYKGVDVLLRAMAQVDAYAVIAGDGPLRQRWTALSSALGVPDRVEFTGEIADEQLRALYRTADVFVLPSTSAAEAFGYVQLEAMASSLPVISTRVPSGVPWVNRHDVTGLTVPPGDAAALAAALRDLLDDPARRARMGAAGAERVRADFSVSAMGDRLAGLCAELAGGVLAVS